MTSARPRRGGSVRHLGIASLAWGLATGSCDTPHTDVVFDNDYPAAMGTPIVYRAAWQASLLQAPLPPGTSSDPQSTVAASENTAYVVLAPGWDPASGTSPTSLVVLQSRRGFAVHLNNTLHVSIDDATFAGNCAAGSVLTQAEADFITQLVFPGDFHSLHYDAASCTTTSIGDGGAR